MTGPDELRKLAPGVWDSNIPRPWIESAMLAAADEWEALERERWDDFSKDDPQSWPSYVHEHIRERVEENIKWRDAMLEYFDTECRAIRKRLEAAEKENVYLRANMPMSVLRRLKEQAALAGEEKP